MLGRKGRRKRAKMALSMVPPSHIPIPLAAELFKGGVSPILPSKLRVRGNEVPDLALHQLGELSQSLS